MLGVYEGADALAAAACHPLLVQPKSSIRIIKMCGGAAAAGADRTTATTIAMPATCIALFIAFQGATFDFQLTGFFEFCQLAAA